MEGIYPNLKDNRFRNRKSTLDMWLKETFDHWRNIYSDISSPDELAKYLEQLQPKERELFIDVSGFVFMLFNELDKIPSHVREAVAIVVMCSIIERLQATRKGYVSLDNWLKKKEAAQELEKAIHTSDHQGALTCLVDLYHSKHGSTQAVTDFFYNYFSRKEQESLIRDYCVQTKCLPRMLGIRLQRLIPEFSNTWTLQKIVERLGDQIRVEEDFLPVCYGVTCYIDYGRCFPDIGCRLSDSRLLEKSLRRVVRRLVYGYRNRFVHHASWPILSSGERKDDKGSFSSTVFDLVDDTVIKHTLDLKSLLTAFQSSLRRFFEASASVGQ